MALTAGQERSVQELTSRHYVNSPGYAATLVHQLVGEIGAINASTEDDPLLYAYIVRDRVRKIAGLVIQLTKWSDAVIESTPDEIFETGAQICP